MTALSEYERLEAAGLWREALDAQRIEVFVSLGDASVTIMDKREQPVAHWSLAAIERLNPGKHPAQYHPDGDTGEILELGEDARDVIEAIEKLRAAVDRTRPRPGRLRLLMFGVSLAAVAALFTFWLPNALRDHAASVLPQIKRDQIGTALRTQIERVTGPACASPDGQQALTELASRLPNPDGRPGSFDVMRNGVRDAVALPGGTILLSRSLVEDFDEPDVLAGFIVEQRVRSTMQEPLIDLLAHMGVWDNIRLLTTGDLPQEQLADYAETLLTQTQPRPSDEVLLQGFQRWSIRSRPYAYAVDVTGETTLGLIEADPFIIDTANPILSDANWLRLQGICGS